MREPTPEPSAAPHTVIAARPALIFALFAIAAYLRFTFIYILNPPSHFVFSDMALYVARARRFLGGQFPRYDTLLPPGTHLWIAMSRWFFDDGDQLVTGGHFVVSMLTCYWVWRASEVWLGRSGALVVLLATALHFPFVAQTGFYVSETFFTGFLALLLFLVARNHFPWRAGPAFLIGFVFALGGWWKGNNSFFAPICFAWTVWWAWSHGARSLRELWQKLGKSWCFFALGCALALAPKPLYYAHYYDLTMLSEPAGGYNFTLGRCPGAVIYDSTGAWFVMPRSLQAGDESVQRWQRPFWDQGYYWRQGLHCLARNPLNALSSTKSLFYLFHRNQLWPVNMTRYADLSRWYGRFVSLLVFPGIVLAFGRLTDKRRLTHAAPFLLAIACLFSAWFFIGEVRYRIPSDVAFLPLSVMGWIWAAERVLHASRRRACVALGSVWFALVGVATLVRFTLDLLS